MNMFFSHRIDIIIKDTFMILMVIQKDIPYNMGLLLMMGYLSQADWSVEVPET